MFDSKRIRLDYLVKMLIIFTFSLFSYNLCYSQIIDDKYGNEISNLEGMIDNLIKKNDSQGDKMLRKLHVFNFKFIGKDILKCLKSGKVLDSIVPIYVNMSKGLRHQKKIWIESYIIDKDDSIKYTFESSDYFLCKSFNINASEGYRELIRMLKDTSNQIVCHIESANTMPLNYYFVISQNDVKVFKLRYCEMNLVTFEDYLLRLEDPFQ